MAYKVYFQGVAYVKAESAEQAIECYSNGQIALEETTTDTVEEITEEGLQKRMNKLKAE